MSAISTVFTNILARTPLSASFNKSVHLSSDDEDPLIAGMEGESAPQKCELRIEGMTCGACVEASV